MSIVGHIEVLFGGAIWTLMKSQKEPFRVCRSQFVRAFLQVIPKVPHRMVPSLYGQNVIASTTKKLRRSQQSCTLNLAKPFANKSTVEKQSRLTARLSNRLTLYSYTRELICWARRSTVQLSNMKC